MSRCAVRASLRGGGHCLASLAEAKGLTFDLRMPSSDIIVQADRRALSQILLNLANNAIKFTEKGEVRIELVQHRPDGRT